MPAAVVTFEFDPIVRIAGLAVRWESIGIAGSILLALLAAALLARSVPVDSEGRRLHADDLLSIAVGAVPGAIVGGRIGYALIHLDYYGGHAAVLFDPTQGGFQLGLAVVGGMLTGAYVARVVDAPVGRWAHTAAIPLLILLGSGKAAMAWGGSGQGAISSAPWATSYAGAGPWGSVAPDLPAQPAQLYESGVALGIAVLLILALAAGGFGRRDGRLLLVGLGLWFVGRVAVATAWRDPKTLGPFSADQLISLGLVALVALALFVPWPSPRSRRAGRRPAWPDPVSAEGWRPSPKS